MLKYKYVVRCFDNFDGLTLGYRLFADEYAAKACARRYAKKDQCGNGYTVYPLTCTLYYSVDNGEGAKYPFDHVEENGSFSEMARRFDDVIKDKAVVYANMLTWFDDSSPICNRYYYVKPVE